MQPGTDRLKYGTKAVVHLMDTVRQVLSTMHAATKATQTLRAEGPAGAMHLRDHARERPDLRGHGGRLPAEGFRRRIERRTVEGAF
jgi:hypothetical protein